MKTNQQYTNNYNKLNKVIFVFTVLIFHVGAINTFILLFLSNKKKHLVIRTIIRLNLL